MQTAISRYEYDQLDCVYIRACYRHWSSLLETIRDYFLENRPNGFGDWDVEFTDEELFGYAYAKYALVPRLAPMTIARAHDDWELWENRLMVPDYLCSYYRNAMLQRIMVAA